MELGLETFNQWASDLGFDIKDNDTLSFIILH